MDSVVQDDRLNDGKEYAGAGRVDTDPGFAREPNDGGDGWGDDPATKDIDEGADDDLGDLKRDQSPQ